MHMRMPSMSWHAPPKHSSLLILIFFTIALAHALPHATARKPKLICGPATGWDIIQFYALNYFAHAFTVKSIPGTSARKSIQLALGALLLPYSGVVRACRAITFAKLGDSELQHAQKVGALCMVWKYGDRDPNDFPKNLQDWFWPDTKHYIIQGQVSGMTVKTKYALTLVPRYMPLAPLHDDIELGQRIEPGDGDSAARPLMQTDESVSEEMLWESPQLKNVRIPNTNTTLKSVVAIGQLIYASFTLWKTSGDQVNKWGYAAFGLTVIPYAVMSFLNLVATALSPDFPALTLIRTKTMDKAEAEGMKFSGVIARAADGVNPRDPKWWSGNTKESSKGFWRRFLAWIMALIALVAPYVIISLLTHFSPGGSTSSQRGLIMTWLVGGQAIGAFAGAVAESRDFGSDEFYSVIWVFLGIFSFMTIAGMVVVGKQLVENGNCIEDPQ